MSKPKPFSVKWKWVDLIDRLGGPPGLQNHIGARGIKPPPQVSMRGWRMRNSVPGKWAPLIILIGMEERDEDGLPILAKVSDLWGGVSQ